MVFSGELTRSQRVLNFLDNQRPILQSRYDINREFLGLLGDVAAARNVRLVCTSFVTRAPETPYVPSQYESFSAGSPNSPRAAYPIRQPRNASRAMPGPDPGLPDFKLSGRSAIDWLLLRSANSSIL